MVLRKYFSLLIIVSITVALCMSACDSGGSDSDDSPTLLPAPATITVSNGSPVESALIVAWSPVNGAEGYRVYRSATQTGTYSQIGSDITGVTTYTDSGLAELTSYFYKVSAFDSEGEGALSDFAVGSTLSSTGAPASPTGLAASNPTVSSLTLSWNAVTGAPGYRLYRAATSGGSYSQIGSDITSGTTYTNNGLAANTTYYYKVSAYNSIDESAQSAAVSGKTSASGSGQDDAAFVQDFIAMWDSINIKFSETEFEFGTFNGDNGGTCVITEDEETYDWVYVFTSYNDTGTAYTGTITNDMEYYTTGMVTATGTYSGTLEADFTDNGTEKAGYCTVSGVDYDVSGKPSAPEGVTVSDETLTTLTVSWDAVEGVDGYFVYISDGDSYSDFIDVSDITCTFESLEPNTTYYITISAYIDNGEEPLIEGYLSDEVQGTTLEDLTPSAPEGVTVSDETLTTLTVSWDAVDGADGYYVYITDGGSFEDFAEVTSGTTHIFEDLNPDSVYVIYVSAYNDYGVGDASDWVLGYTLSE
ncbi:MAG TPA: fibronectin type III domain-containing protein [Spirochaetota bacterium]|nr:fibronectin type III domain-containing protein [Spirochaetota bacterium]